MKTKKTTEAEPAKVKRASAKKAAKANGQATRPVKKLSQIAAAVEVLRSTGEPMTCKAMAAKMLLASPGGKTPEEALYATIAREIATKGKHARFVKAAPGRFAARA